MQSKQQKEAPAKSWRFQIIKYLSFIWNKIESFASYILKEQIFQSLLRRRKDGSRTIENMRGGGDNNIVPAGSAHHYEPQPEPLVFVSLPRPIVKTPANPRRRLA